MKQILFQLSVGPLWALVALIVALVMAWRSVQGSAKTRLSIIAKALPSLGMIKGREEQSDLFFASVLFLGAMIILLGGLSWKIPVFSYGASLMLGFIAAIALACSRAHHLHVHPNHIIDMGMIAVVFGVIGSRAFYVAEFYQERFAGKGLGEIFAIWQGGMVFYGGLLIAALACILYAHWRGYRIWVVCDVITPTLALGLAFGRLGCFLNGCCWGAQCSADFPLAVQFPAKSFAWWRHVKPYLDPDLLQAYKDSKIPFDDLLATIPPDLHSWSHFVHPTQIYSWAVMVALCLLLILYERTLAKREGQVSALFFALYALFRFSLETLRADSPTPWNPSDLTLSAGQSLGLWVFPGALVIFIGVTIWGRPLHQTSKEEAAVTSEDPV